MPVFVQKSHGFAPPADDTLPAIMVGPGTGVAPFRAFLEEREARGAKGPNWLFFGEQKRATDFLYEDQIVDWQRRGVLAKLDLAFSRDQTEKVYVQHRMRENAAELWAWLDKGAHFYVCGDARRMAKDVEDTLLEIAAEQGGKGRLPRPGSTASPKPAATSAMCTELGARHSSGAIIFGCRRRRATGVARPQP